MGSYHSDSDVRLVQQGKRGRLDIVPFGITTDNDFLGNNVTIDVDYKRYLYELKRSGTWRDHEPSQHSDCNGFDDAEAAAAAEDEEDEVEEEEEEDDDDDDDEDDEEEDEPDYKSFLANLQGDGHFYALQVVADDCRPLLLKYHDDFSDDELEFISARRKVPEKEQVVYKRNLRSNMKRDVEKSTMKVLGKDKREIQKNVNNVLGKDKGEIQPSTKIVLSKDKMGIQKGTTNVPGKDKKEKQKSVTDVLSKRKREIEKGETNHLSKRIRCSLKETETVSQKGHHGLGKKPGGYSQKPTPHGNKSFMTESCYEQEAEIGKRRSQRRRNGSKHEVQGVTIDECYKRFLDCLSPEGDCLVLRTNNEPCVRYEGYGDDSSDSEVLVASNISDLGKGTPDHFESSRPSILVEEDGRQCHADARSDCSEFRKKLMEKLRQPYNQVEHKRLWELLNERKVKMRHIDLRGSASAKSFPTDESSDSFLEHFNSLKIRIDAVKTDRHKVLNLMRGFFFWLENVAHEVKFQPWLDDDCLKVMPGSHKNILMPA